MRTLGLCPAELYNFKERLMFGAIGRYFNFAELKTDYRSEVIGGVTTFMAMAYIIFNSLPGVCFIPLPPRP